MEEPYGFFGAVNPTGHNAIYFQRICAASPVELRRCLPGEMGSVIARYQGINGYDWVAIPLLPYLYAVEDPAGVPAHVDHDTVVRLRNRYRETHLESLGARLRPGNFMHGGWTQLVGAAYERRIYVFRFATTPGQDDALIARMNAGPNHSSFNLLFNNCADFARVVLNGYFPGVFNRSVFPDAGMTTPKQITYKLVRYARRHPETQLKVYEIPQIPGYRRSSHAAKGIDESFVTTAYAIPLAAANPYLAGGLFVDYLVRGRYHLIPNNPEVLGPGSLWALSVLPGSRQDSVQAVLPASIVDSGAGEAETAQNSSAAPVSDAVPAPHSADAQRGAGSGQPAAAQISQRVFLASQGIGASNE